MPSTTPKPAAPPISLRPVTATHPAARALVTLHNAAFASDTFLELMYGPLDEDVDPFASEIVEIIRKDPTVRFTQAVISRPSNVSHGAGKCAGTEPEPDTDTADTEIPVGWSWWNIYPDRQSYLNAAKQDKERAKRVPEAALNPAAYLDWKAEVVKRRERWIERNGSLYSSKEGSQGEGEGGVAILQVLAVHPDYQNLGIGTQLLKHGLEEVKQTKVPTWLEASDEGYHLYTRCGFRNVHDDIVLDMTKYGRDGVRNGICMLRDV